MGVFGDYDYESKKARELASSLIQMSMSPEGDMSQHMTETAQKTVTSLLEFQQEFGKTLQAHIAKDEQVAKRMSELEAAVAKLPHEEKNAGFLATSVFDEF